MRSKPKILFCSMPDAAMAFRRIGDMPNLGLVSIAAGLFECEVRILDLNVVFHNIGKRLLTELKRFNPDIVGLSSMSFQFNSAKALARIIKNYNRSIFVLLGGYHASMAFNEFLTSDAKLFDILIRSEGEKAFPEVLNSLLFDKNGLSTVSNISYYDNKWVHNPNGPILDLDNLPLPNRNARIVDRFLLFGKRIETVETSRGCTQPCNFCSISKMYGQSFRTFPVDRVIEDIKICIKRKAEIIFFVDDNITLDIPRFKSLCEAIIKNRLNKVEYITQVSAVGISQDHELSALMREAGFSIVFLGIENNSADRLLQMGKGDIRSHTKKAIEYCHKNNIAVIGGFITGLPDDGPDDVRDVFKHARSLMIDHVIVQCITPYPNTELRQNLIADGMVINKDDYSLYNGYICNVKTNKMNTQTLNRIMNWENIKLYFNPHYIKRNRLLKRENSGLWKFKVFVNSLEHFPALIKNRLFASRHTI